VLSTADLAAAIVRCLGDDAAALARAELVCAALRDAVAPHWRRLCLELVQRRPAALPACIPAGDARQWRTLHRCMTGTVRLVVKDQDNRVVGFNVRRCTKYEKIFNAYCMEKRLQREQVRFLFDGQRINAMSTPYDLRVLDDDSMDAMMEQVGD
jgi:small ubiquitin-related modifier